MLDHVEKDIADEASIAIRHTATQANIALHHTATRANFALHHTASQANFATRTLGDQALNIQNRLVGVKPVLWELSQVLLAFFSREKLAKYLRSHLLGLLTRLFTLVSLYRAAEYASGDENDAEVTMLHKEAILSYTVLLQFVRLTKVLQITSITGSFVHMLDRMVKDVVSPLGSEPRSFGLVQSINRCSNPVCGRLP